MNGEEFPQDPKEQLMGAVRAVFRSWDNPRAIVYRRMNDTLTMRGNNRLLLRAGDKSDSMSLTIGNYLRRQ